MLLKFTAAIWAGIVLAAIVFSYAFHGQDIRYVDDPGEMSAALLATLTMMSTIILAFVIALKSTTDVFEQTARGLVLGFLAMVGSFFLVYWLFPNI